MAYAHGKYTVVLSTSGLDGSASGVVGYKWNPGFVPHVVRAVGLSNSSTLTFGNALVCAFNNRRISSASTATAFATLNAGTSSAGSGTVLYKAGLNKEILPGDEVHVHITTGATGAVLVQPWIYVEPHWETPGNNSLMIAST